jgi:hypothetical protein
MSRDGSQRIEPTFGGAAAAISDDGAVAIFEQSTGKTLGLIVLGILMTGLSTAVAFRLFSRVVPGSFAEFAGYAGMLLFSLATITFIAKLFQRRDVLQVNASGILDRRISSELIPWTAISEMRIKEVNRQRFLSLQLHPAAMQRLRPPLMAKILAGGRNVRDISMTGLDGSFEDLLAAVRRAVDAAKGAR